MATDEVRGSRDYQFRIGETQIYVGPGGKSRRRPIMAISSPGDDDVAIVAEFMNSTSAEHFVRSLIGAAGMQLPADPLDEDQMSKVVRFGLHKPLSGSEARAEREALEQVDEVEPFIDWFTEEVVG